MTVSYKTYDEAFGEFWSKVVELAPKLGELGPAAVNATEAFDNGDSPAEAVRLFEMTGSLVAPMKTLTENDYCDLTETDYEFLQDREPNVVIETGFETTYASALEIYYKDATTIVLPRGEWENCEPWKFFEKRVTAEAALALYRKECTEEDAESADSQYGF